MIKNKKIFSFIIFSVFLIWLLIISLNTKCVFADQLNDSINEQLNNLDLSKLESFFNSISQRPDSVDFFWLIKKMLNGETTIDASSFLNYILNIFLSDVFKLLPIFICVIAIGVLSSVSQNLRLSNLNESVSETIFFSCNLCVILLLSTQLIGLYKNIEIVIKNIAILCEIMLPIITTLMLSVGGNVSVAVYKPIVVILSGGIINLTLSVIMPLIIIMTVFNITSSFSPSIKLNKFSDLTSSTIKWIIGIIITVFSIFLSIQGLTSAHYDGISFKVTKYAISNSIPIIGGFIKDGFDIVVAGSVIIKNTIGVALVFALIFLIVSPFLSLLTFSLLLKLTGALLEPICDSRISNFCLSISKTVTYLIVALLSVGLMFFITVILLIISANAFV